MQHDPAYPMNIEPLVLPCAKSDAAASSPNTEPNRRLLMIDDNREIHGDFRKVLCPSSAGDELDAEAAEMFGESPVEDERQQFEIDSAFQGAEGVALLRAAQAAGRPYAVAFVDVRMPPGMDGAIMARLVMPITRQTWRRLRSMPRHQPAKR